MSEKFPATDETIISPPLSDDEFGHVAGGTPDRTHAADDEEKLKVQIALQRENQVYASVSNVMSTRNDTAKNSIGN